METGSETRNSGSPIEVEDKATDSSLPNPPETSKHEKIPMRSYFFLLLVVLVTVFTFPRDWARQDVSVQHVWYYGWITAIATGLGALPFFFISEPSKKWMGISNAIAGGMMIAASYSLVYEGITCEQHVDHHLSHAIFVPFYIEPWVKTLVGFVVGLIFIVSTKQFLSHFEDLKIGNVQGTSAQRMVLILFVMTLHSLSEGIGIGVSFGGKSGMKLGSFISLSLAMHNVPEGLAVALAANSRRLSPLQAGLWAIFTSLPQPLTAVPAYLFVDRFLHYLPAGLGFAAGAMGYVSVFELLTEAAEEAGITATAVVGAGACLVMLLAQDVVKGIV